jgi:hypothetical protein
MEDSTMEDSTGPTHPFMLLLDGIHEGGKVYDTKKRFLTLFGFDTYKEAHAFVASILNYSAVYYINGREQHSV